MRGRKWQRPWLSLCHSASWEALLDEKLSNDRVVHSQKSRMQALLQLQPCFCVHSWMYFDSINEVGNASHGFQWNLQSWDTDFWGIELKCTSYISLKVNVRQDTTLPCIFHYVLCDSSLLHNPQHFFTAQKLC